MTLHFHLHTSRRCADGGRRAFRVPRGPAVRDLHRVAADGRGREQPHTLRVFDWGALSDTTAFITGIVAACRRLIQAFFSLVNRYTWPCGASFCVDDSSSSCLADQSLRWGEACDRVIGVEMIQQKETHHLDVFCRKYDSTFFA